MSRLLTRGVLTGHMDPRCCKGGSRDDSLREEAHDLYKMTGCFMTKPVGADFHIFGS